MDSQERPQLSLRDFFEEASLPLRLPLPPSEVGDISDLQDPSLFNFEDSMPARSITHRFASNDPAFDDCTSIREEHDVQDTNPLDELFNSQCQPPLELLSERDQTPARETNEEEGGREFLCEGELEGIISFLVQNSNVTNLEPAFRQRFPSHWESDVVRQLVEKFRKLKKTKEELVKYCMRKAFKFILDLPKNQCLLQRAQTQKFSFAKSKERFLKKVSDEKSMNAKFLQQIFHQGDFSADYVLFLEHFQQIMLQDNRRKVKYLAELLGGEKGRKGRQVVEVRRMPWTTAILQRVRKISLQLLKYSG